MQAETRDSNKRDEKLEEYQEKVERMQRLMEEERLVGESKIRQLVEQNEALRLHLKLAVESLKNPIRSPTPAESIRDEEDGGNGTDARRASEVEGSQRNTSSSPSSPASPQPQAQPATKKSTKSITPSSLPNTKENTPPSPSSTNPSLLLHPEEDDLSALSSAYQNEQAQEMQAHMEELLKDLGLFKRKVADDRGRFSGNRRAGSKGGGGGGGGGIMGANGSRRGRKVLGEVGGN